jgi:disulfide oxidoreductase YuzD
MKRILVVFLLLPVLSRAEAPEKILPKTLVLKSVSWYESQAVAWREEISHHQRNAEAWLNYYAASYFGQQPQDQLNQLVGSMEQSVPGTFELLVVKGWNSGYQQEAYDYLQKAYTAHPEKPETYGLLQSLSEFNLDEKERALFSDRLVKSSQVSTSLLSYSYNVLMSLEPSSVLITEGESTTTPLYILQDVMHVRKDISILNLDLLTNTSYLEKKFKSLGLSLNGPINTANLRSTLCALLPADNKDKKFYYALTVSKDNLSSIKEYLYVVGLASVHSLTNVDNIAQIRKNLEKEFLLDYLRVDFNGESKSATGKIFSANYLVPMILLYEAYRGEGNQSKAKELRQLMEKIAADTGKENMIASFLEETITDEIPYFSYPIIVKELDGKFRPISDKLHAQESEVTNEQYNYFLNYLSTNSLTDLYEKYKFDFSAYDEPALSLMKGYVSPGGLHKKGNQFKTYPAVNIRYESAIAYCDWLTTQYNNSPDHKFKKVKFRLPSIDEWQVAAAGFKNPTSWKLDDLTAEVKIYPKGEEFGKNFEKKIVSLKDPEILYPWFRVFNYRNSVVNRKGCYLGNFKVPDNITCPGIKKGGIMAADGFLAMSITEAYFPNDVGLFDVVGNVAEMTLEKGKACGGSWNHTPEESTIKSINAYTKPDAAIGFRIFMEIVEK